MPASGDILKDVEDLHTFSISLPRGWQLLRKEAVLWRARSTYSLGSKGLSG